MKLISNSTALSKKLIGLIDKYSNIEFAVAWASSGTKVYEALLNNKRKIRHAVIGTHFYQTHPDVLDDFIGKKNVHFILQPSGVFHPKVYCFWNKDEWELLIGSANLTAGALGRNSELMLHLTSDDSPSDLSIQTLNQIKEYWTNGLVITKKTATTYRELWRVQQSHLDRISGTYFGEMRKTNPIDSEIMSMTWNNFYKTIKSDPHHSFEGRCDLLNYVHEAFENNTSFSKMELGIRKSIAGTPGASHEHWAWFGSMKGAGYYKQAVNNNNPYLSNALDEIPLEGAIQRSHYLSFIKKFKKALPNGGGVGNASRLLALKRPDYFVCFNGKNKSLLCKDFGIIQSNMTYKRYWDDIICSIIDSVWWNEPRPKSKIEILAWSGRAAMIDAIYYEPKK